MWLPSDGVKAGSATGATDECGEKAVEVVHSLKVVHTALLHLLGFDDNKLICFHTRRCKQLSQTRGSVIKGLIG